MALLCFAALILLLGTTASAIPDVPSVPDLLKSDAHYDIKTLGDLNNYLDSLLDLSNLHMAKAFATETRRYKRALDLKSVLVKETKSLSLGMENPTLFNISSLQGVRHLKVISTNDADYILLSYGTQHVLLEEVKQMFAVRLIARFNTTTEMTKVDFITTLASTGKIWIAFASSDSNLIATAVVDLSTKTVQTPQVIIGKGLITSLHMFEVVGEVYLLTGVRNPDNTPLITRTYKLEGQYFDHKVNLDLQTKNVTDMAGFAYYNNYYIVLGTIKSIGSELYEFDTVLQTMNQIQQLPDTNVKRVVHFLESQEDKHYIIINSDVTKIYRWAGQQLLLWQDVNTASLATPIRDIFAFTVSELETILLFGNGGSVTFFADDVSANFISNHTMLSNCPTVGDLSIITMNAGYAIFYVCHMNSGTSHVEYKEVVMEEMVLEKPLDTSQKLIGCLNDVQDSLNERESDIKFLEHVIDDQVIMTTDQTQKWSASMTFLNGLTVSGKTTFDKVTLTRETVQTNEYTFTELQSSGESLEADTNLLSSKLSTLLYHSGDQEITGDLKAQSVTVDNFSSDSSTIKEMNSVPLKNLTNTFLIDGIDQDIDTSMTFHTLTTDKFTTRENSSSATINGMLTEDLMRKNVQSQTVTGKHTYNAIVASSISGTKDTNLLVNGVDTSLIVTTGSSATLSGDKTFTNLVVHQKADVSLLNDVDLSSLNEDLVFKNKYTNQILTGNYDIGSLKVTGNVDAALINGINLQNLNSRTVKTTGDFILSGPVDYNSLVVTNELDVATVNNISWSNIVSIDTPTISGHYTFSDAVVNTAVNCNNINDLDISEDVVTTNTKQTLLGNLTIADDLVVSGIEGLMMSETSTINTYDPLDLLVHDHLGNLIIKSDISFNSSLKVTGDVMADSINSLSMTNIENRYWRKGNDQQINVPLSLLTGTFSDVVAGSLNGHQITDYFSSTGFQTITGNYTFKESTTVDGNMNMKELKTINGIDVSALSLNTVNKHEAQDISAVTTFASALKIGDDLELSGLLNGWDVTSDFMRLDKSVNHTGHLTFAATTTIANDFTIENGDLSLDYINDMNITTSSDDLVLVNENATIKGSLTILGTANVENLWVQDTVDGVSVPTMDSTSMKKSGSRQASTMAVTVDNLIFNNSPDLSFVNNKNWTTHLGQVVPRDYTGSIEGVKTFTAPMSVTGNFDPELINGMIDIASLAPRILTKSTAQTIEPRYTFNTNITAKNLNSPIIDGINTSDLLLIDENANISGTVHFENANVIVTDLSSTSGALGKCNLVQVNNSAVWISEDGSLDVDFPLKVTKLIVKQNATARTLIEAGTSKRDLSKFLGTLVTKSTDQEISGRVEFTSDLKVNNLSAKMIDGVNLVNFYDTAVLDNEAIVINGDLRFPIPVRMDKLVVNDKISGGEVGLVLINGINVTHINENAVLRNGVRYTITGDKTFTNGLAAANVNVGGTLGGVKVEEFAVLSKDNILPSHLTFKSPITVKGNVQVDGLLQDVNLDEFLAKRIKLDSPESINSSITFHNIKVDGNLDVNSINDIPFSDIVFRSGVNQIIDGSKTFGHMTVNGLIDANLVNGIDIKDLEKSVVKKNEAATINGNIIFKNSVSVTTSVNVNGKVNNWDLSELGYGQSQLESNIQKENAKLKSLNESLSDVLIDNLFLSCDLYETILYGTTIDEADVEFGGKMTLAANQTHQFLVVQNCSMDCSCPSDSNIYQVSSKGQLGSLIETEDGASFGTDSYGYNNLLITHRCSNGTTIVKIVSNNDVMYTRVESTVVTDFSSFVVNNNNGTNTTYIVTLGKNLASPGTYGSRIDVFQLHGTDVYFVHTLETVYSASTVDLYLFEDGWKMLVANKIADKVDPFTVPSKLYAWNNGMFHSDQEFIGQYVTSGIFLKSKTENEVFISLPQLTGSANDNRIKFDTEVLIFKQHAKLFLPYQSLHSFGVVAQSTIYVGKDLFLLLLSQYTGTLDVYDYRPSEGFHVYQKIPVCKQPVHVEKFAKSRTVYVSCLNPPKILTIRFDAKGFSYLE